NRFRFSCTCGDENGENGRRMAGFVEILQIQCIIPYLIHCSPVKGNLTYLEFKDEYNRLDKKNGIDPPAHARDAELQMDCPLQTNEVGLEQANLLDPGVPLGRENREIAIGDQPPND